VGGKKKISPNTIMVGCSTKPEIQIILCSLRYRRRDGRKLPPRDETNLKIKDILLTCFMMLIEKGLFGGRK
jgi:hypothetical protein